ncbi:unnamed protein product [Haemonchus placei]|uniref:G_PROTEIN_RECEP_F1_2 domain-containing protein n=1 Tax=Haemonchus placei TaxID=6290 RepID=A0A0N4W891_HAEPC|nr:unnamed protein product [Haemonchus placei]
MDASCLAYTYLSLILRSPNIVRSLKAMLINICTMQILTALTAAFLQGRLIASGSSIAILSEGPLRMFGPMAGLIAFDVVIASMFYIELLIAHTVFWRYRMLQLRQMNKAECNTLTFSLQFREVSSLSSSLFPLREVSIFRYGEFGGFESESLNQRICVSIGIAIAITSPILILYLRRLILKTFDNSNHHIRSFFLQALTMQAMLPILSFVPASLLAAIALASGSETPISEYLSICITTLPCVIDPLIAFYCVPPYRAWVLKKLCKRSTPIKAESTSKSITSSHIPRASVITPVE